MATSPHQESNGHDAFPFPWMKVGGLLLLGLVLMGMQVWREYDGLTDPETMEMATLARNMVQGRGFVASAVRPADVWFMTIHTEKTVMVEHMPDIRHGPVFPSLLAAVYLCSGLDIAMPLSEFVSRVEFTVILPMTIVLTLLGGFLCFVVVRRLSGDEPALLLLAVYVISLPVLEIGVWGGASALLLFLGAATLCATVKCVSQRDGEHGDEVAAWLAPLILAAFLAGLACLTRYGAWVLTLVMLIYMFHGHDRKRCWISCIVFLGTVLLVISPWLIRNITVTGTPFGISPYLALNHSALFESDGFDASLNPVMSNLSVTRSVKAKLIANSVGLLQGNLASVGAGVLLVLFGASLFVRLENERLVALRHSTLAGVLGMVVTSALWGRGPMASASELLPCILVLATAGFYGMIHNIDFREPEKETLAVLFLLLWVAAPTALTLFASGTHRVYPPYHPPFIRHVSGLLSRSETLCTDIPWATAWYGGRTSILLPRTLESFHELKKNVPSIAALYVTTETARRLHAEPGNRRTRASWRPLMSGQIPRNFPFTESITFPVSTRDQWFFTDRQHLSSQ